MPKGKPWTVEEEKWLRDLIEAGETVDTIASKLGKSPQAVMKKIGRLGLKVVVSKRYRTTTSLSMPGDLPSVEETLKILAAALKASAQPALDKVEVQRLQVVATLARAYKDLLVDYINYRQIEAKLIEMEDKYERLTREAKGDAAEPYNAAVV